MVASSALLVIRSSYKWVGGHAKKVLPDTMRLCGSIAHVKTCVEQEFDAAAIDVAIADEITGQGSSARGRYLSQVDIWQDRMIATDELSPQAPIKPRVASVG